MSTYFASPAEASGHKCRAVRAISPLFGPVRPLCAHTSTRRAYYQGWGGLPSRGGDGTRCLWQTLGVAAAASLERLVSAGGEADSVKERGVASASSGHRDQGCAHEAGSKDG